MLGTALETVSNRGAKPRPFFDSPLRVQALGTPGAADQAYGQTIGDEICMQIASRLLASANDDRVHIQEPLGSV